MGEVWIDESREGVTILRAGDGRRIGSAPRAQREQILVAVERVNSAGRAPAVALLRAAVLGGG